MGKTIKQRGYNITCNHVSWDDVSACIFYWDHKEKEPGKYPVKIRVTHKQARSYFDCGSCLTPDDWVKLAEGGGSAEVRRLRVIALQKIEKIKKVVEDLQKEDAFSFEELALRYGRGGGNDVFSAYENHIAKLIKRDFIGNSDVYSLALKSFKEHTGTDELPFKKITRGWVEDYETEMRKKGRSVTTISMYLRTLKHILTEKRMPSPFGKNGFHIKAGSGRKISLTKSQINDVLMKHPIPAGSVADKMRDLFYFSYLANGMNLIDIVRLRWKDIISTDEIFYKRMKTDRTNATEREIFVPYTPPMKAIVKKWGHEDNPYIFGLVQRGAKTKDIKDASRILCNVMNKKLRAIAKATGLPPISSYSARHSFASVLMTNKTNLKLISQLLGHSRLSTTENYLKDLDKEDRRAANELLY